MTVSQIEILNKLDEIMKPQKEHIDKLTQICADGKHVVGKDFLAMYQAEYMNYMELRSMLIVEFSMKRQTPIRPITYTGTNRADCPVCGATMRGIGKPYGDWCSKCGQALDWTEN